MKPFKKIAIAALAASVAGTALTASLPAYAQSGAANADGGQKIQKDIGKRFAHMGERGRFGGDHGPRGGRQRVERLFDRFDTDGDGTITAVEIEDVRTKDFASADADGNGEISLEEFKAAFLIRSNGKMVRAFQFLDNNGDGTVTQEEIDRVANRMFSRLDRDDNGVVEKVGSGQRGKRWGNDDGDGQRADARKRGGERGWMRHGGRDGHGAREGHGPRGMGRGHGGPQMMFMATFDTDGDGKVSREDFDAKRAELFALADANGSGSFTLSEFSPLWLAINEGRIVNMFQSADADGSLGVTPAEHDERSSKLMEKADRNGDGVITKADFKRGQKAKDKGKQRG